MIEPKQNTPRSFGQKRGVQQVELFVLLYAGKGLSLYLPLVSCLGPEFSPESDDLDPRDTRYSNASRILSSSVKSPNEWSVPNVMTPVSIKLGDIGFTLADTILTILLMALKLH